MTKIFFLLVSLNKSFDLSCHSIFSNQFFGYFKALFKTKKRCLGWQHTRYCNSHCLFDLFPISGFQQIPEVALRRKEI